MPYSGYWTPSVSIVTVDCSPFGHLAALRAPFTYRFNQECASRCINVSEFCGSLGVNCNVQDAALQSSQPVLRGPSPMEEPYKTEDGAKTEESRKYEGNCALLSMLHWVA